MRERREQTKGEMEIEEGSESEGLGEDYVW